MEGIYATVRTSPLTFLNALIGTISIFIFMVWILLFYFDNSSMPDICTIILLLIFINGIISSIRKNVYVYPEKAKMAPDKMKILAYGSKYRPFVFTLASIIMYFIIMIPLIFLLVFIIAFFTNIPESVVVYIIDSIVVIITIVYIALTATTLISSAYSVIVEFDDKKNRITIIYNGNKHVARINDIWIAPSGNNKLQIASSKWHIYIDDFDSQRDFNEFYNHLYNKITYLSQKTMNTYNTSPHHSQDPHGNYFTLSQYGNAIYTGNTGGYYQTTSMYSYRR